MITAGIDIGSNTAKAAVIDGSRILATQVVPSGFEHAKTAESVYHSALETAGCSASDVRALVSTGYGRNSVPFADKALTEIICHAAGVHFIDPAVRGVIDVGGQDSKAISIGPSGSVDNFAMNDKCAAGTGRFIEVMARTLDVSLEEFGSLGLAADEPAKISSICTVFAESEVISMIARQEKRENIIAGIHESAASRICALARKIHIQTPVMMTGGVAKNKGMVKAIESVLETDVRVGTLPQETGAVGAAVLAAAL